MPQSNKKATLAGGSGVAERGAVTSPIEARAGSVCGPGAMSAVAHDVREVG